MKLDQSDKALEYIERINRIDNDDSIQEEVSILVLKAKNLLNIGKYA